MKLLLALLVAVLSAVNAAKVVNLKPVIGVWMVKIQII